MNGTAGGPQLAARPFTFREARFDWCKTRKDAQRYNEEEVDGMLWFSWNPWDSTKPRSESTGYDYAAIPGPLSASQEAVVMIYKSGGPVAYLPVRMGWM